MKKQRIYLDTSVFGGFHDDEFKEFTKPFFKRIKNSDFVIIFSNITEQELENAPFKIRETTKLLPNDSTEYVKSDPETAKLAKKYIEAGVVGPTSYADCLHIALATKHNANILVSWPRNFGVNI